MTDPFAHHSGQYVNQHSEAENREFTRIFGEITEDFHKAMREGLDTNSPQVQDLVRRHYEFCLLFWKPSKEAYKALAMSYILPSPYKDAYDKVAEGLGKYHYDAICIWADENL